ncbi:hypothetical protein FJZ39_02880 [Candidatus Saccharibacteria bacterium]|nr:hypothetical protein [Candidatus Saccharibacteria bacterium]
MYIALLGRQPSLSLAELERRFGASAVTPFLPHAALVDAPSFPLEEIGGTIKAGKIVAKLTGDWRSVSMKLVKEYASAWQTSETKITLGVSAYGIDVSAREVQKTGIVLKQKLKKHGVNLRLLPNTEAALSSATSHHNKLGLSQNKVELLVIKSGRTTIIAESIGAQNITAIAARDQKRPKRDAFVGMLPPKLAQIIINLAVDPSLNRTPRILDPFCGTGVLLQEAGLMGYDIYGTDLSDKMIDYSQENLAWIFARHKHTPQITLHQGDAMTTTWQQPISAIACETYLGQPFSAPPSPAKLKEVQRNCNHIIGSFLRNLHPQLANDTTLCVAVPAWRTPQGSFVRLPLASTPEKYGYSLHSFTHVDSQNLLYARDDQIVGRQLLVLRKIA